MARKVFLWALAVLCESPQGVCIWMCIVLLIDKAVPISRNEEVKIFLTGALTSGQWSPQDVAGSRPEGACAGSW